MTINAGIRSGGTRLGIAAIALATATAASAAKTAETPEPPLAFDHSPAEIKSLCDRELTRAEQSVEAIEAIESPTFATTVKALEDARYDFQKRVDPVTFLKYVSPNADVRKAAGECELRVEQFGLELFTRKPLYESIEPVTRQREQLSAVDKKLLDEYVRAFEKNGLDLSPEQRETFLGLKNKLAELENQFSTALNEWSNPTKVSREELEGMSDSFIEGLEQTEDGKYLVTLAYPHYYPIMKNAKNADLRRRLQYKYFRRGGEENRDRLQEAINIRHRLANLVGYETHADFTLTERMAQSPEEVLSFLGNLDTKLEPKGREDLAKLLSLKREELDDPDVSEIKPWDWRYYANLLKKTEYQVDHEAIKEYFPLSSVLDGMFEVYQALFGVRFVKLEDARVWHDSVQAFAVYNEDGKEPIAYFYMDLFPREGKYGHAAAFTLHSGRQLEAGAYQTPVSSIVANFNAPSGDKPSLLLHDQVETLFHEFGHILHQTLTTAEYGSLSGTSVKRDFVEAPSQIFENWVWNERVLDRISSHYETGKPLPEEQLNKLIAAKSANQGIEYLRQVFFATLDMTYHTRAEADTTAIYRDLIEDIMLIGIPENTYPEASFGHLMGGYDAGYYGYLWSEVYSADMFTRFEDEGLYNETTGADYRNIILEPGGTDEPIELITEFLGREPNQQAFLESLGIEDAKKQK